MMHTLLSHGEYIPDLEGEEVEIAKLTLEPHTRHVLSIRAHKLGPIILFIVIDEHESPHQSDPKPDRMPLSFDMIVELIESVKGSPPASFTHFHTLDR